MQFTILSPVARQSFASRDQKRSTKSFCLKHQNTGCEFTNASKNYVYRHLKSIIHTVRSSLSSSRCSVFVLGTYFFEHLRVFQDFQVFAESQKNMILKTKFSTVDPKTTRRGLWSLPGDIFRSNSSEKKKTSNMECYRIQTNSEANADPESTRTSRSKTASSFFAQKDESKNKWKLSSEKFSRPSDVLDPLYDTERSSSTRHSHLNLGLTSMNLVPRSAKGRDSGLLITPRSSRLEEMDDASAALILASYGSNVARRTT